MRLRVLDSDVLIDIGRDVPAATEWLTAQPNDLVISGFTAFELLQGCHSKLEAKRTRRLIDQFPIHWPLAEHSQRGLDYFSDINLRHGISIIDVLIAETAIGLDATLLTFNTKHLGAVPGVRIEQPYTR